MSLLHLQFLLLLCLLSLLLILLLVLLPFLLLMMIIWLMKVQDQVALLGAFELAPLLT
jgi:hypothetical protein